MKIAEIVAGTTYKGRSGPDREVRSVDAGNVVYRQVGRAADRSCWISTFIEWTVAAVQVEGS